MSEGLSMQAWYKWDDKLSKEVLRGCKGKTQPTVFRTWTSANMMCVERLVKLPWGAEEYGGVGVWVGTCKMRNSSLSRGWGAGFFGGQRTRTKAEARKALSMEGWGTVWWGLKCHGVLGAGVEGGCLQSEKPWRWGGKGLLNRKPPSSWPPRFLEGPPCLVGTLSSVTTAIWGQLSCLGWTIYFPRAGGTCLPFKTGVPNLQDQMPDDLRWSWCNNNRNKVHNTCNVPDPQTTCLHPGQWKYCLLWNHSLAPKRLGTVALEGIPVVQFTQMSLIIAQFI